MKRTFLILIWILLILFTFPDGLILSQTNNRSRISYNNSPYNSPYHQSKYSQNFSQPDTIQFLNVASQIGVAVSGGLGDNGLSFSDYNNDDLIDIFLAVSDNPGTGIEEKNILLMNMQNFLFNNISTSAGITNYIGEDKGGVLLLDFDNDNDKELFIVDFWERNYYYENNNGVFIDNTIQAGLQGSFPFPTSSGTCAGDYNNDGYLDIYVGNANGRNYLYLNNGNGTFTDITFLANVQGNNDWTKGAVFFDYDNDNDSDLLISKWPGPPTLYQNNNDGTFTDVTMAANLANGNDVFYFAIGDYNDDGYSDMYWGKIQTFDSNILYQNNGDGTFTDVTSFAQVGDSADCRSTSFIDFNNDGFLDLFVSNALSHPWMKNRLYKNNGDGTFTDIAEISGVSSAGNLGSSIWGDYDNDGDLDIFMNRADSCIMYQNQGNSNNWLKLKLIGVSSNKDAVGAKICLYVDNHLMCRYVIGGFGNTQHSSYIHFGLNQSNSIDSLKICWPGGIVDNYTNLGVNQFFTIVEDSGLTEIEDKSINLPYYYNLRQNYPNPFNPITKVPYSISKSVNVNLSVYDILGRKVQTLVNEYQNAGEYIINFNGNHMPGGIYLYELRAGDFRTSRRMLLMK